MIYILGTGYVGKAFAKYFAINSIQHTLISRKDVLYTNPINFSAFIASARPSLLINAAGFVGEPNVDACEDRKLACLYGNAILPGCIGEICQSLNVPWVHVSSGCIYDGSKRLRSKTSTFEYVGYNESDPPNFTFRQNSSYYSGCKAMGEELLSKCNNVWVCRLRIPFNEQGNSRNYLTKLSKYESIINVSNSITQIDEYAAACYSLFKQQAPFGIYNVTNPGVANSEEIVDKLLRAGIRKEQPKWINMLEFNSMVKTPRSNCLLDSSKLLTVYPLTDVNVAIDKAISEWVPQ